MERIEKPWGYEEIWALTNKYVGKILHINCGQKLSLQYHKVKEETILVLEGRLTVENGECSETFDVGSKYHVKPGQLHRFCCPDDIEYVRLIEVSTPELDDVVRVQDNYGRL